MLQEIHRKYLFRLKRGQWILAGLLTGFCLLVIIIWGVVVLANPGTYPAAAEVPTSEAAVASPTPALQPTLTPTPLSAAGVATPPAEPAPEGASVAWVIDLAFVDEAYGWALGRSEACETERFCPIALSATHDGGETWQTLPAPDTVQSGSIAPGGVEALRLASRSEAWLFRPALFSTRDGGRNWIQHQRAGDIIALEPVGRSVWAIERVCSNIEPGECELSLLLGTDQNRAWQPSLVQPALEGNGAQLVRFGVLHAWIVHEGGIAATRDGRASWHNLPQPCDGPTPWINQLVAHTADDVWLLCTGPGEADGSPKALYRSFDGGTTWELTAATSFTDQDLQPDSLPMQGQPNDLAVPADGRAFVALVENTLFGTRDGGQSWSPALDLGSSLQAVIDGGGVWRVLFADEQYGWAVGNRWDEEALTLEQILLRTIDGGDRWELIALTSTD